MMTLRTHTIEKKEGKKTQIWEWEETPELKAFIKQQSFTKLSTPPTRPV